MRKLAIILIALLVIVTVLVTVAVIDKPFRDGLYGFAEGTFLMPMHNFVVSTWVSIGTLGFTYIMAASIAITIVGFLFGYFVIYAFFYKRIYQGKIKGGTSGGGFSHQDSPSGAGFIPMASQQNAPIKTSAPPKETSVAPREDDLA